MDKMLVDALNKVTMRNIIELKHGEELALNEEYTLYHYTEEDVFVINKTNDWEELFQVLISDNDIIFESLS